MITSIVRSALPVRTVGILMSFAMALSLPALGTARAATEPNLPKVSVPEFSVSFDRTAPALSGSARITNDSQETQSGLYLALELVRSGQQLGEDTNGDEISNEGIAEWTLPDSFTLEPSATRTFTYNQAVSPLLNSGTYFATLKVYGPTGIYLASKAEGVVIETANGNRFLNTVPNSATVTVDGTTYPSLEGPQASGTVRLHLQVRNPHTETIRFAPVVDGFIHTVKPGDTPVFSQTNDPVDIAANATADVTVDFPAGTAAGSHLGMLRLHDPASGLQIGPDTEFRWIVTGSNGKIISLSPSSTDHPIKSTVSASAVLVGPADDSSLDNASLRLTVTDGDRVLATVTSASFHIGTDSLNQTVEASVPRQLRSFTPGVKVELLAADGSVLDTVTGTAPSVASIFTSWAVWMGAGVIVAILAILIFLITKRRNRPTSSRTRKATALALALMIGGSLIGISNGISTADAAVRPSTLSGALGEVFSKAGYTQKMNIVPRGQKATPVCSAQVAGEAPTFSISAAPAVTWNAPAAPTAAISDYGSGNGSIGRGQTVVFNQILARDYKKNTTAISRFHTYMTLGRIDGTNCSLNVDPPDYGDVVCGSGGPGAHYQCQQALSEINAQYRRWAAQFTHARYVGITATSNNEIYYSSYIKAPADYGNQDNDIFPFSFVTMGSNAYSNDQCWVSARDSGTTPASAYMARDTRLTYYEDGTGALIDVDNAYFKQNYSTGTLSTTCTNSLQPGSVLGTAYDVDSHTPVSATIKLLNSDNLSDVRKSVNVDPSGEFTLLDLPLGTYYVAPVADASHKLVREPDATKYPKGTNGYKVTLTDTARTATLDFGYQKVQAPLPSTVGGSVYGTDANGVKTIPYAFPGGSVTLKGPGTTLSAYPNPATGSYSFANLSDGTYTLNYVPGSGWTQTVPKSPTTYSVSVSNGQVVNGKDFGATRPTPCTTASISGSVSGQLSQIKSIKATGTQPGNSGSISILTGAGFKISNLKADTYSLSVELNNTTDYTATVTPPSVTLATCTDSTGVMIDIKSVPTPPVTLNGKVTFVILDSANPNYIGTASVDTSKLGITLKDGSTVPVASNGSYSVSVDKTAANSLTLSGVDSVAVMTDPSYTYTPWVVTPGSYTWASAGSGGTIPNTPDFTVTSTRTMQPGTGSVPNYSTGSRRW